MLAKHIAMMLMRLSGRYILGGRAFVDGGMRMAHSFHVSPAVLGRAVVASRGRAVPETGHVGGRGRPPPAPTDLDSRQRDQLQRCSACIGILGIAWTVRRRPSRAGWTATTSRSDDRALGSSAATSS